MKTISNYTEVSEAAAQDLLSKVNAENVELTIDCLHGWRQTGYGHWKIGVDINIKTSYGYETVSLTTTITNSLLKDSWNDPDFIEEHGWYDSEQSVIDTYFYECLTDRNIKKLNEAIAIALETKTEEE